MHYSAVVLTVICLLSAPLSHAAGFDPGTIGIDQTICPGTVPAPINNITLPGIPAPVYFWQQSIVSGTTGFTVIPGATSINYAPGIITQNTWFRRAAINGTDTAYTPPVKITVMGSLGMTITADQTICSGSVPAMLTGPNFAGLSYKWISSVTSATSGYSPASGVNNGQNYSPGALTQNTWYKRVATLAGCSTPDTTNSVNITITPPTVGGTAGGGGTFCQGPGYTFISLTGYTGTIVKWQSSTSPTFSSGITDIVFSSSPYPATTSQFSSLYYRAIVKNGVCPPETSSISPPVIVIPQTVAGQVTGGTTVCAPTNSTTLTLTGYIGSIIKWQSSLTADFSLATDIINTTNSLTVTNLSVKTFYRAWVQNGSCTLFLSAKDSISIYPAAVGGTLSGGNTVCAGTNSTLLTLTAYNGNIQSWEWSTTRDFSSGTNTIVNSTTSYTAINLTSTRYYRAVVSTPNCPVPLSYSAVDSIVVIPQAIGGILLGGTTVCSGTNTTLLTLSGYSGSIIRWESSPDVSFSSGIVNITNTTNTYSANNLASTLYFRVILQNGSCPLVMSAKDSVVVVPQTVGGTLSGGGAICPGNTSKLLTLNGYTGTIIKWQSSTSSNFSSGVTDIANTTNTYTAANLPVLTYYRVVVQNGSCPVQNSSTTSVAPPVVAGTLSGGNGYCSATNSTTFTLTGNTGTIVRWESCLSSSFLSGITNIANNTNSLTVVNAATTIYYRVLINSGSIACPGAYSNIDSIVIYPVSVGGIVSGNNDTVCAGTNSTILTVSGHTGSVQWQASTTSAISGFSNISGATSATYTATNISVKMYYRAIITSGVCASAISNADSIMIRTVVIGGIISGNNDTVCTGANITTLTLSGYIGSIQWQASIISANSGFSDISGATNTTFIATNLSVKTYYRVIVTNGMCLPATSTVDSIMISTLPVGGIVTGNNDTVCAETNSTILTLNGYSGSIQWQTSTTSANAGFSNIIGANAPTYTANNLSVKTYFRVVVTNGVCPPATSTVDSIMINSQPVGGIATGSNDTVCAGTNSTILTLSGYSGSIQWQTSATSATSGFSNIIGANASTYVVNNISAKTYYRAVVTNGICPPATSAVDSILISTIPVGGFVAGSNDTVCAGTNSTILTLSGYSGNIQWQISTTSANAGFSNIIGANAPTYTANNLSVKTYFRVLVTNGVCPSTMSDIDSVVVKKQETFSITADTIICYGKRILLVAQPTLAFSNPIFTWYSDSTLHTVIASGDTFTTGILTSDTLFYLTINGTGLCESSEIHKVQVSIDRNCENISIGLSKLLSGTTKNTDGSFNLTFNFVTIHFGDEPLADVRLKDDLTRVFPTATIKVLQVSTPGNWNLNSGYDGVNDIELLDTGNRFNVGDRQSIQMVINLKFPRGDTSTTFLNVAEIRGMSIVNGKQVSRKSKDGPEPQPDSLATDSSFVPTPVIIPISGKPEPVETGLLFIPEGFSPNGDNVYDYFVIENPQKYKLYVAIFNRWGNILYENNDYDNSWDGKAQKGIIIGEGVPDGTYFYIVEYTDTENNKHRLSHSLTILR
jgi:gliding motility-associated-like protein